MSQIRSTRVSEQMQREIAEIIRTGVKDPRVGFVTVTDVEVSGDLQHAKVFISVLGNEEARSNSLLALQKASGYIRGEIGRRIRLRLSPELHFKLDTSMDHSVKIQEVLRSLEGEETKHGEQAERDE